MFNLYTDDLPVTCDRKFTYTDDICLATQSRFFSELECRLSSDLTQMSHYCRQWHLKLKHSRYPTYLVVTLCRTVSFREHSTKIAGKLKNRISLLMKLAGSSWGASAKTLWTSAMALCYSVTRVLCPCLVTVFSRWVG